MLMVLVILVGMVLVVPHGTKVMTRVISYTSLGRTRGGADNNDINTNMSMCKITGGAEAAAAAAAAAAEASDSCVGFIKTGL